MGIKHTKVSTVTDVASSTLVRPSDWNADHTIDGDVDFGGNDLNNVGNPEDFGATEFIGLDDVPATYAGAGNKLVAVNAGATGLTFIAPSAGGPVDEFVDLIDVPGSYSGQAGKVAAVNALETALEFVDTGGAVTIQAAEPAVPVTGEMWVDPDTQLVSVNTGTKWDWNKKSTLFEVSDDGLEANVIAGTGSGLNEFILATAPLTGKMVFGFSIHNTLTGVLGGNQLVGVANIEYQKADDGFFLGGRTTSCSYGANGGGVIYQQVTVKPPPGSEYSDGDLNYIAVDMDASLFWARTGSNDWNWDVGADPATGTGGVDISLLTAAGQVWPAACTRIIGDVITLIPDPAIVLPTGFVAYSTATPFTEVGYFDKPNIEKREVNPRHYGAVGDGRSHPLNQYYATLADAQEVYPFATSLTQEVDWAGCMLAGHVAFGRPGFENASSFWRNRPIYIPEGRYMFGDDQWLIRNLSTGIIRGAGKQATQLMSSGAAGHVMIFDGIWYSTIENLAFIFTGEHVDAASCLNLDGNFPGHPYDTRSQQSTTIKDCFFNAAGNPYCLSLNLYGGSGSQGDGNTFINLHMLLASYACFYQIGQNSIGNNIIGGDCQQFRKYGLYLQGTCNVFGMNFESNYGFDQVTEDGYDIYVGAAGAEESMCIHGCRSESMRFLWSGGASLVDVRAISPRPALTPWIANFFYTNNFPFAQTGILVFSSDGHYTFMRATVPGTSGAVQPTWPAYGSGATVNDGSQVWEEVGSVYMHVARGSIDYETVYNPHGLIESPPLPASYENHDTTSVSFITPKAKFIDVDATAGPVTVDLQKQPTQTQDQWRGRTVTIKKTDSSANAVTVKTNGAINIYPIGANTDTLTVQHESRTYTYFENGSFFGYLITDSNRLLNATHSAIGAETVTGYITIKDASGTNRKVAVVS